MNHDKKRLKKEVAGSFPTVTVITIEMPSGDTHGMTASSFLQFLLILMILLRLKRKMKSHHI